MLGITTSNTIRLRLIKMLTVFFSAAVMKSNASLLDLRSDTLVAFRNFAAAIRSMLHVRSRCLYHSAYILKKYVNTCSIRMKNIRLKKEISFTYDLTSTLIAEASPKRDKEFDKAAPIISETANSKKSELVIIRRD